MPAFFMKQYLKVIIPCTDISLREILIALLPDLGLDGIEEKEETILAYAEEKNVDVDALEKTLKGMGLEHTTSVLQEENWNASWESNFAPVIIPGKILIRADFHQELEGFDHSIVITPKMSFGTGHHATTRMMLEQMLEMDMRGKRVLDFGTGTGVLAILASRLGAVDVKAIDNDDWSIMNAVENIQRNACENIEVEWAEDLNAESKADIILANINKHILLQHASAIRNILHESGYLLISGLLSEDYDDILLVYSPLFGDVISRREDKNWISLLFKSNV
ncbi:MAG: 50S ribosomal protein L11 methyltransferase [Chitinophagia bacterium]|jgi:ribosomal protein L11 methyltransferase